MPGLYTMSTGRIVGPGDVYLWMSTPRQRRQVPYGDQGTSHSLGNMELPNLIPEAGDYVQQFQLSRLQRNIFWGIPYNRVIRRDPMEITARQRMAYIQQMMGL